MELRIGEKIEIQPCTEEGQVTLEAKLGTGDKDYFDSEQMGVALRYSLFKEIKYSKEMGYAFAHFEGKRIHIFKQGKIIIRRANDVEDALRILKICVKTLIPAVICESKQPAISCYKGVMKACLDECLPIKQLIMGKTDTVKFLDVLREPPDKFKDRRATLEKIFEDLIKRKKITLGNILELIETEKRALYTLLVDADDPFEISIILSFLALYENIEEILIALFAEEKEINEEILEHVSKTFEVVKLGDEKGLDKLQPKNKELLSKTSDKNLKRALEGIEHLSRAVLKTALR
jgi:hypothetical protein